MTTEAQSDRIPDPSDATDRDLGVVVGFDGSPNSEVALRYAAGISVRRGSELTVITAYRARLEFYAAYAALPPEPEEDVRRHQAEEVLRRASELLKGQQHGRASLATVEGDSVGALADASADAELIVVGARGRGGFLERVLGSVSDALPGHATCPTIVVPDATVPEDGPVVVGTDGSDHGRRAVLHAAQEAADRGARLLVVMALPMPDSGQFWYPTLSDNSVEIAERRRAELQQELDAEVARVAEQVDGLEITGEVRMGEPAAVLQDASQEAQLTVVGSRGRGAIASALLGSISRATLHGAAGPVMVVPPQHGRPEATR